MLRTVCVSRTEAKREETRRRILEVAEQLFIREDSYEQTTIREIASRVGVSVGTVYIHFKTKADILTALVVQFMDGIGSNYDGKYRAGLSGAERLEYLLAFFDRLRQDKIFKLYVHFSNLNHELMHDDTMHRHVHHELACFGDHIASIITDGIADGSLQWRGDPSLASLTMMAMAFSLIGALVLKPPFHEVEPIPHNPDEIFACFQRFIRESLHSTVKNA